MKVKKYSSYFDIWAGNCVLYIFLEGGGSLDTGSCVYNIYIYMCVCVLYHYIAYLPIFKKLTYLAT